MQELVSPGSSVGIIDESMYVQTQETSVPLFIIASAAEKQHPFNQTSFAVSTTLNGATCVNCAIGTYEHGVVRTVTSLRQSLELYGIPRFLESADGRPHHGDARNEYGLLALNNFLAQGRRAYVVRANINLNDTITDLSAMWLQGVEEAADVFESLTSEYLRNYNDVGDGQSSYVPLDPDYKTTLTAAEVKQLVRQALGQTVFKDYSFANSVFQQEFLRDHGQAVAGYIDVQLDDSRGYVVGTDLTGLDPDETYQINIGVNGYAPNGQPYPDATSIIEIDGADARTYAALVAAINVALSAEDFSAPTSSPPTSNPPGPVTPQVVCALINGRLRFTSSLAGTSSSVELTNAGLTSPLFVTSALELVVEILSPVRGRGNGALRVYSDFTYTALNTTDGEFDGFDDAVNVAAAITPNFTAASAAAVLIAAATEFQYTKEFRDMTSLGANDADRRARIVEALVRELKTNTHIRNELYEHNLISVPGYPEVGPDIIDFIKSRAIKEEVFGVGSVPLSVAPDGPGGLLEWNAASGVKDYNMAYYYPHPLTRNSDGKLVVGCSSMTALRTIAYNDFVGEPWFAPAGVRRGTVVGASDVGYVTGELGGPTEFVQVHLQEGQRDNLYTSNINPITFFPSQGIVIWGQKTTQSFASALDRVATSRLVKYAQRGIRKGSLPFVFEQNDYITREQFRAMIDNFLNIIMLRRGLYDYAVICDESNNTPERIERQEMWADVAIKPTKQAEFIYVPIRVVQTSADIGTNRTVELSRR